MLRISWSLNKIDDKLALVIGVATRGKMLLFETGVPGTQRRHWNSLLSL